MKTLKTASNITLVEVVDSFNSVNYLVKVGAETFSRSFDLQAAVASFVKATEIFA